MIWRKHYRSMYEGSMVGAGAVVFALMGYVISHQDFDRKSGWYIIRLNPVLIGAILGEKPDDVKGAIEYLCRPDDNSTSKEEEGRRLVALDEGTMEYRVVNGEKYQEERDYEARKIQNREAQRRWRENHHKSAGSDAPPKPVNPGSNGRFKPPTPDEAAAYADEIELPQPERLKFLDYFASNGWKVGRSPMKDWQAAMRNWKARLAGTGTARSVFELKTVMQAKELLATQLKEKHCSQGAMDTTWDTPENQADYRKLRGEIKGLQAQIAGMA